MPPTPPPLKSYAPGLLIADGRYRLKSKIGAGGNGTVWLADHVSMGSEVVIKFPLRWSSNQQSDEQLHRESEWLVGFSNKHPHIVNVLDIGKARGQPFVVMQYMQNGSLLPYCGGALRPPQSEKLYKKLTWLTEISSALDYLHNQNLIHCDVKPANVLLDDSHSAYLSDFGIATAGATIGSSSAKTDFIVGSLPYIAPELFQGKPSSPASDQFALAATLYEFTMGRVLFAGGSGSEVFAKQQELLRTPDSAIAQLNLPRLVGEILIKAMSENPAHRYSSCGKFAEEICRVWRDMPMSSPKTDTIVQSETLSSSRPSVPHARDNRKSSSNLPPLPKSDASSSESRKTRLKLDRFLKKRPDNSEDEKS